MGIQPYNPQDKLFDCSSAFYGIANDKPQVRTTRTTSQKSRQNKSISLKQNGNCEISFGILTPNLLKSQYHRYERSSKSQSMPREACSSARIQNLARGSTATAFEEFRFFSTSQSANNRQYSIVGSNRSSRRVHV